MEWNGHFFVHRTLADLGLILYLGHAGKSCPHVWRENGPQTLTIGDVTGVHDIRIGWCRCAGAPSFSQQLFNARFFPASYFRPRTAFTFRLLKFFHLLSHVARTTPWDFAGTLHRITNNVDLTTVPVSPSFQFKIKLLYYKTGCVQNF
jgi:hypothetical protein